MYKILDYYCVARQDIYVEVAKSRGLDLEGKRLRLDDRARIIEQRREVFESLDYELNTIRTGGVIMADAEEKHQFLAFPFIDDYWNFSTDVTQE